MISEYRICFTIVILFIAVSFSFSASDSIGKEGVDASLRLSIVKNQKVRLGNPVSITITPRTVSEALENDFISNFEDEDYLSPNRATGMVGNF